jgi:hypothetical protein
VIDMAGKKKNKSGAPGTWGVAAAFDAEAAKANGAAKKKRGEQLKITVDSRDAVRIAAKHELHRTMTDAEWEEQSALLAANSVELMGLENEIRKLKEKHAPRMKELRGQIDNGARQCDAREWLTMVECIEVHDVSTNSVTVFADVNGELGAEVIPSRKMRDDEREAALKSAPFEPPPRVLDPPSGDPIDAEDGPGEEPAGDA